MTKKETQLQWLAEIYPTLEKVARPIVMESEVRAEDAISNAVVYVVSAINRNQCRATTLGQFKAYCRKAVWGQARELCTTYNGDVRIDYGKENAIRHMRPDQRRSNPPDYGDSDPEMLPFDREETVGGEETDDMQ